MFRQSGVIVNRRQADQPVEYFTSMYDGDEDPWGFDSRWYEQRKFQLTCAALPRRRYRLGLEPGCANGTLTAMLADRCDALVSYDLIESAVARAQARLADRPHVRIAHARFPDLWPEGGGDLVVWSEIAYYLSDASLSAAMASLRNWLVPAGDIVAVHYTGNTNYPRSGHDVSDALDACHWLSRRVVAEDQDFTLGVWRREVPEG